jgi:hypothetical protein
MAEAPQPSGAARWIARLPLIVFALACALGAGLRLPPVGAAFLWGDEYHSLAYLGRSLAEVVVSYDPAGSGLALPLLQRALVGLIGPDLWALRGPSVLGGIGALIALYPVARPLVGSAAAALATLALAINPVHVFYSYYGRAYALAVVLTLLLIHFTRRAVQRPTPGALSGVALCVTLLPWVHLTSGTALVAAACAAGLGLLVRRAAVADFWKVAAAFASGAVLCMLLHAPAWEGLESFIATKAGAGAMVEFGAAHVADLLAGGRTAGIAGLTLVAITAAAAVITLRGRAIWVVIPALLPLPILLAVNPRSLPFVLVLLSWGGVAGVRRLVPREGPATLLALGAGSALLLASLATGPLPGVRAQGPRFAAIYTAMHPIEAFDAPAPTTPAPYRDLAEGEVRRVIEVPPPAGAWGLLLLRNYALQHGRDTRLGTFGRSSAGLRIEPVVRLGEDPLGCDGGAEWIVLHRNLRGEVRRYKRALFHGAWRERMDEADHPFADSFRLSVPDPALDMSATDRRLRRRLGEPAYEDAWVGVWKAEAVGCGGPHEP